MQCKFIKHTGKQCQAQSMKNSDYCFRHNPNHKDKQLIASRKGGEARRLIQIYGKPIDIKTPQDVKNLLGKVISGVWAGEIPAGQPANTIGFLSRCFLDAYEKSEIEERLVKLEENLSR